MKIVNNPLLNIGLKYIAQSKFKPLNSLQTDVFQKSSSNVYSNPIKDFVQTEASLPEIEVLPNVSDSFVSKITQKINEFPKEWLKKFKEEGYKIILAPTFAEAYKSERVFDPAVLYFESKNPTGTLGVTYENKKMGKKFFAFCDKPPLSEQYMSSIVNHEFSHGIVNITGADKNPKTLELLKKDVDYIIKNRKLDNLTPDERTMIFHYFFNKNAYLPIDEISADICAWNKGAGIYGSGLILDVKNPNLMKELFPNLSAHLDTIKP